MDKYYFSFTPVPRLAFYILNRYLTASPRLPGSMPSRQQLYLQVTENRVVFCALTGHDRETCTKQLHEDADLPMLLDYLLSLQEAFWHIIYLFIQPFLISVHEIHVNC